MVPKPVTLICLPYAGGSSYAFGPLLPLFDPAIRPFCPELPGRGRRTAEPCMFFADQLVTDILASCRHLLQTPYMIYGHSMGALLGYLLAKRIAGAGLPQPFHLIFTGRAGPSAPRRGELRYRQPTVDFYNTLRKMGGVSEDLLRNRDYMEFFEPVLRADFQLVETWEWAPSPRLKIPITIITGSEEDITPEDACCWTSESTAPVEIITFPGNHFFIYPNAGALCHKINLLSKNNNPRL